MHYLLEVKMNQLAVLVRVSIALNLVIALLGVDPCPCRAVTSQDESSFSSLVLVRQNTRKQ